MKDGEEYAVVDLKTGGQVATQNSVRDNTQLMTYQLALAHGELVMEDTADGEWSRKSALAAVSPVLQAG